MSLREFIKNNKPETGDEWVGVGCFVFIVLAVFLLFSIMVAGIAALWRFIL
jgi:hypothetical protein